MDTREILKLNLVIEPDVQNLMDFVIKTVARLNENIFAASQNLLPILQQLRRDGAGSGQPIHIRMLLRQNRLQLHWKDKQFEILQLNKSPSASQIEQLHTWISHSLEQIDPDILLQRNVEMTRYFNEARIAAESELQQRLRELQEATQRAETDGLTGLFNRRCYDARLKQAFLHTMRQRNAPLSLMLFDLDFFKEINDTYGHQYGDDYLNKMASVLREIIRENVDMAFRFGGDEFAVLLFADHTLACQKAQQVLARMENKVSIGISSINLDTPDNLSLEQFIRHADNALYSAKRRGRGQGMVNLCNQSFPCSQEQHATSD